MLPIDWVSEENRGVGFFGGGGGGRVAYSLVACLRLLANDHAVLSTRLIEGCVTYGQLLLYTCRFRVWKADVTTCGYPPNHIHQRTLRTGR